MESTTQAKNIEVESGSNPVAFNVPIKHRKINSRSKGKRGERQWRDELRAAGYDARRGQQFSGSPDSPDVICAGLPWAHFEVKAVEKLNIENAMRQARGDCAGKEPIVAHRRNRGEWLVTMSAETFFKLLRGDFQ